MKMPCFLFVINSRGVDNIAEAMLKFSWSYTLKDE